MVDPGIDAIFNPTSVALVGASGEEGKMGNIFAKNLLSGYQGKVYLINPKGGRILDHEAYRSIKDLPEARDKHGRGGIFLGQAFLLAERVETEGLEFQVVHEQVHPVDAHVGEGITVLDPLERRRRDLQRLLLQYRP